MRLPSAVTRTVSAQALATQKNAPHWLFAAGLVGSVASTVLACRATLKLEEVVDEAKSDLDTARGIDQPDVYSEQDRTQDIVLIYARSAGKLARLYAPSVVLGGLSIAALTKSHNILNDRVTALSAAYTAVSAGYERYREKVIEKYGLEQDREFRQKRDIVTAPGADGKPLKVTVVSPDGTSPYAKFFDQLSPNWSKEPEYNLTFLVSQQNWANDKLRMQGHLFLNEVYDSLGIPRTRAGSVVGWSLSSGSGDNYIDFGIFDDDARTRAFVNGFEGSVLLDFNVDGVIIDYVEPEGVITAWQS